MATDKKLKDPAEAALSAIEQALSLDSLIREGGARAEPRLPEVGDTMQEAGIARDPSGRQAPPRLELGGPAGGPQDPPLASDVPSPDLDRPRREGGLLPPDRSLVANDDRRNIGILQQTLRARPSRKPYLVALVLGLAWIGGLTAAAWAQSDGDLRAFVTGLSPLQAMGVASALAGPVILFVVAAMLAVRAHEMRLVARAVGEVAVRLAEPEGFSTDAVLTMSQTVRREVAAVGDGVERALARAGELETLVRGEIATLERAYSDNEIRIRSLVEELVAQREAIVTNAERVRGAIAGSHQNLSQELDGAAQRIVSALDGAGERVTGALDARGAALTATLGEVGDRVVDKMDGRGEALIERLAATGTEVREGLRGVGSDLIETFRAQTADLTGSFETTGRGLTDAFETTAGA